MSLLEIAGLVAGYGRGPDILQGADLAVEPGQVHCLIGPNGAGKSTLLKTVAGLIPARAGVIRYQGERIDRLAPHEILMRGICFVPQERALFPRMTVRENLRMGGYVLADRRALEARIDEALQAFPILAERAQQKAGTLSGGQQQMLAMARTLILRPALVMLDEPSLGLAPKVVVQMYEIMHMLKARGVTILLVEQNAVLGLRHADHGHVLDLGRTLFGGPAGAVLDDPRIQELYLGKPRAA
jgi:branched-chain amino acid transport system ATP-binding protein